VRIKIIDSVFICGNTSIAADVWGNKLSILRFKISIQREVVITWQLGNARVDFAKRGDANHRNVKNVVKKVRLLRLNNQ
jgi:hypothetical protein